MTDAGWSSTMRYYWMKMKHILNSSFMADHDFTKELAFRKMNPGGFDVVKSIRTIDDRPDIVLGNYPDHIFQVPPATDSDRPEAGLAHEHGHEVDITCHACKHANQSHLSP